MAEVAYQWSTAVRRAKLVGPGQFNCYVNLKLQNVKSATVTVKGNNPSWEQDFIFETSRMDIGLIIEVWNKGMIWDKLLGSQWLPLMHIQYASEVGPGNWMSVDAELVMKDGEVVGTKMPTGHSILLEAHFELPYDLQADTPELQRKLEYLNSIMDQEIVTLREQDKRHLYSLNSGMSEDSDYTSDVSYPTGQYPSASTHHPNSSASQYGGSAAYLTAAQNTYEDPLNPSQQQYSQFPHQDSGQYPYEYESYDQEMRYEPEGETGPSEVGSREFVGSANDGYGSRRMSEENDPLYYNSRPHDKPHRKLPESPLDRKLHRHSALSRQSTRSNESETGYSFDVDDGSQRWRDDNSYGGRSEDKSFDGRSEHRGYDDRSYPNKSSGDSRMSSFNRSPDEKREDRGANFSRDADDDRSFERANSEKTEPSRRYGRDTDSYDSLDDRTADAAPEGVFKPTDRVPFNRWSTRRRSLERQRCFEHVEAVEERSAASPAAPPVVDNNNQEVPSTPRRDSYGKYEEDSIDVYHRETFEEEVARETDGKTWTSVEEPNPPYEDRADFDTYYNDQWDKDQDTVEEEESLPPVSDVPPWHTRDVSETLGPTTPATSAAPSTPVTLTVTSPTVPAITTDPEVNSLVTEPTMDVPRNAEPIVDIDAYAARQGMSRAKLRWITAYNKIVAGFGDVSF